MNAKFIKIKISTDGFKLNMIPIPISLSSVIISIIKHIYLLTNKSKDEDVDVKEILNDSKKIIKELKKYPPFEIINVENKNTHVVIKTK